MIAIETPRLLLRPGTLADADDVQRAKLAIWDELQRWMVWSFDDQRPIEALRTFISSARGDQFVIGRRRDTGQFVIATGLDERAPGSYEVGYWVNAQHRRRGFATEATHAMLRYAFDALKAKRVTIGFYAGNENSAGVIAKLDFRSAGTQPGTRPLDGSAIEELRFYRDDLAGLPPLDVRWR